MKENYEFEEQNQQPIQINNNIEDQYEDNLYNQSFKMNPQEQMDQLKQGLTGEAKAKKYLSPEEADEKINEIEDFKAEVIAKKQKKQEEIKLFLEKHRMEERLESIRDANKNTKLTHLPEKSVLTEGYAKKFTMRLSDKNRAKKLVNKRSRLYQKMKNVAMMDQSIKEMYDSDIAMIKKNIENDVYVTGDAMEDVSDISAFMDTEKLKNNSEIVKSYFGTGEMREGQDVQKALDIMLKELLSDNISDIRLENDKAIAENVKKLEKLARRVAAFDRLSEKNNYMATLDDETKRVTTSKLKQLRAISHYYIARKEVITDPLYMSRYNDEISKDFTATTDPKEQELAKKLLRADVMLESMMEQNDASDYLNRTLKKKLPLVFERDREGEMFIRDQKVYMSQYRNDETLLRDKVKSDYVNEYATRIVREKKARQDQNIRDRIAREKKEKQVNEYQELMKKNALEYEGEWYAKNNYEDAGYDETKVMDYFDQFDEIKLTDFQFESYKDLLVHFKDNYELLQDVDRLWYEIARALDHGFKNDSIDDYRLKRFRAKCGAFLSLKNTMLVVQRTLYDNPDAAMYSDEEWAKVIKDKEKVYSEKSTNYGYPVIFALRENPNVVFDKWMEKVDEEDATKEESIRKAWPYITGKPASELTDDEVHKRMESYNVNAIVQDYLYKDFNYSMFEVDQQGTNILEKQGTIKEQSGKNLSGTSSQRLISALGAGKSVAEQAKIINMAHGSPEERMEFLTECIKALRDTNVSIFTHKDGDSVLDNYRKKAYFARFAANMDDIGRCMKTLVEKNPKLKLPEGYESIDEIVKESKIMFELGYNIISAQHMTFSQLSSTRWLHGFNKEDMLNQDMQMRQRINELMPEMENTDEDAAIGKIMGKMMTICRPSRMEKGVMYNKNTDFIAEYEKMSKKYDEDPNFFK